MQEINAKLGLVQNYTDIQGLTELRASARDNPDQAIAEVAAQFESIFVQMMMKSMRDASIPLESGLFSSDSSRAYQQLFDQQLGMDISSRGGIGLAEIIERQLSQHLDVSIETEVTR